METRVLLVSLALAATAAHARPFKEMCEQFEPLRKISDLQYIKPRIRVQPKAEGVKPQDVVFLIEAKSGVIKVSPGPEGLIEMPFSDKLCAENPNIEVNQPPGTLSLGISIDPAIPPVRTLDYRLLDSLRREWSEAISRQSIMWRMLAPSAKAFQIVFEPGKGGSAEVHLPGGVRKLAADEKGELRIAFEDSWIAANPTIVLSDVPRKIGLAFK
jgi:hypothetical protein